LQVIFAKKSKIIQKSLILKAKSAVLSTEKIHFFIYRPRTLRRKNEKRRKMQGGSEKCKEISSLAGAYFQKTAKFSGFSENSSSSSLYFALKATPRLW